MDKLLHSREFWGSVIAAVFNLVLFFAGKYAPQYVDDIKFVVATVDPIIAAILLALFVQTQVAKLEANVKTHIESLSK